MRDSRDAATGGLGLQIPGWLLALLPGECDVTESHLRHTPPFCDFELHKMISPSFTLLPTSQVTLYQGYIPPSTLPRGFSMQTLELRYPSASDSQD